MNTIKLTKEFSDWRASFGPGMTADKIRARLVRFESGNPGNVKSVGGGVFEMRIDFGPGIRMYYIQIGLVVYLMVGGGDKSTQASDIKRAQDIAARLKGDK